jgi:DNA-binding response OmpR family regulator
MPTIREYDDATMRMRHAAGAVRAFEAGRFESASRSGLACGHRPRILLATDDAEVRTQVATALCNDGATVDIASSGYHLIELMADAILDGSAESRPDLVIADATLAGCTGTSVLAGLRQLQWPTPAILMVPRGDERQLTAALALGAVGVFFQPVHVPRLLHCARRALSQAVGERPGLPAGDMYLL